MDLTRPVALFLLLKVVMLATAVAPGDEDELCTVTLPSQGLIQRPYYPTNVRILMDSRNYNQLLDNQGAVWQQLDFDSNNPNGITTNWIQQSGTPCRQTLQVCGWSAGTQNNWLITQLISRTVDSTPLQQVGVQIEFELRGCAQSLECQRLFEVHKFETSSVDSAAARDRNNYVLVDTVAPNEADGLNEQNHTVLVDFDTSNTSFYLAIRDVSSCIVLLQMIVFYYVCPSETFELALRPETIAPPADSALLQVNVECVENASPSLTGVIPKAICAPHGTWTPVSAVSCQCNDGFRSADSGHECVACLPGTYFSAMFDACQPCPNNSNSIEQGLSECPCIDGFYRIAGEEDLACEVPPNPPRNIMVSEETDTSLLVMWDPPIGDHHGNITYILTYSGSSTVMSVIVNGTQFTVTDLIPGRTYRISVRINTALDIPDDVISVSTMSTIPLATDLTALTVIVTLASFLGLFIAVTTITVIIITTVCCIKKSISRTLNETPDPYYDTVKSNPKPALPLPHIVNIEMELNDAYGTNTDNIITDTGLYEEVDLRTSENVKMEENVSYSTP